MNQRSERHGPHDAAIEQARILRDYLMRETSESLDIRFIRAHVASLLEFANEAKREADFRPSLVASEPIVRETEVPVWSREVSAA